MNVNRSIDFHDDFVTSDTTDKTQKTPWYQVVVHNDPLTITNALKAIFVGLYGASFSNASNGVHG